ncbi:MAG: FecR domain-containing protein [Acidobacteriota bacterium]
MVTIIGISAPVAEASTVVTVAPGQSLRQLAAIHLKNPDLWPEILKANGLDSAADIKPGLELIIPTEMIENANKSIETANEALQEAAEAGARLFALDEFQEAEEKGSQAQLKIRDGDWIAVSTLAGQAAEAARSALRLSKERSIIKAEAVLRFKKGTVQSRRHVQPLWRAIDVGSVLVESELVRTLADSLAEILLRNESRIRLNENSQAMIRKMRVDMLHDSQESEVSLLQGDVFVLLAGGTREEFDLSVSGVSTSMRTSHFWVEQKRETSKFANYDGELEIAASGETVVLKKNQGSKVEKGLPPTPPKKLLGRTGLLRPQDRRTVYRGEVALEWEAVTGARRYWLEVAEAKDDFSMILTTEKDLRTNRHLLSNLGNGPYFWRVYPMDEEGFPGEVSEISSFIVVNDEIKPFVILSEPQGALVLRTTPVQIRGRAEAGARVEFRGKEIPVGSDGKFLIQADLEPGENLIVVRAVDRAGNLSEVERKLTYRPDGTIPLTIASASGSSPWVIEAWVPNAVTVAGKTEPDVLVRILDVGDVPIGQARADSNGDFSLNVRVTEDEVRFSIELQAPAGQRSRHDLVVRGRADEIPATAQRD